MFKVIREENERGRTTECTDHPPPGEESVVRTMILDNSTAAQSATQSCAREKQDKVGAVVWMWWRDASRSDDGRMGPAAVCNHINEGRSCRGFLRTRRTVDIDTELWPIGLALDVAIEQRDKLQTHGVKTVAVLRASEAAIRRTAHHGSDPGQPRSGLIDGIVRNLLAHGMATIIHWVPGHTGIPWNEEVHPQANSVQDASRSRVIEGLYTWACNRARLISEGRSAANAK